jgi:hypothetical protein
LNADETDGSEVRRGRQEDFELERYKYILQQIHVVNENVYRFLAIYQGLAVTLVGAGVTLFVGYRKWQIAVSTARSGIVGLLWLLTAVAAFTSLLIIVGVFNWLDYRREECELTDIAVRPGFRGPPSRRSFLRWYETYILLFIAASIALLWVCTTGYILPSMK